MYNTPSENRNISDKITPAITETPVKEPVSIWLHYWDATLSLQLRWWGQHGDKTEGITLTQSVNQGQWKCQNSYMQTADGDGRKGKNQIVH